MVQSIMWGLGFWYFPSKGPSFSENEKEGKRKSLVTKIQCVTCERLGRGTD